MWQKRYKGKGVIYLPFSDIPFEKVVSLGIDDEDPVVAEVGRAMGELRAFESVYGPALQWLSYQRCVLYNSVTQKVEPFHVPLKGEWMTGTFFSLMMDLSVITPVFCCRETNDTLYQVFRARALAVRKALEDHTLIPDNAGIDTVVKADFFYRAMESADFVVFEEIGAERTSLSPMLYRRAVRWLMHKDKVNFGKDYSAKSDFPLASPGIRRAFLEEMADLSILSFPGKKPRGKFTVDREQATWFLGGVYNPSTLPTILGAKRGEISFKGVGAPSELTDSAWDKWGHEETSTQNPILYFPPSQDDLGDDIEDNVVQLNREVDEMGRTGVVMSRDDRAAMIYKAMAAEVGIQVPVNDAFVEAAGMGSKGSMLGMLKNQENHGTLTRVFGVKEYGGQPPLVAVIFNRDFSDHNGGGVKQKKATAPAKKKPAAVKLGQRMSLQERATVLYKALGGESFCATKEVAPLAGCKNRETLYQFSRRMESEGMVSGEVGGDGLKEFVWLVNPEDGTSLVSEPPPALSMLDVELAVLLYHKNRETAARSISYKNPKFTPVAKYMEDVEAVQELLDRLVANGIMGEKDNMRVWNIDPYDLLMDMGYPVPSKHRLCGVYHRVAPGVDLEKKPRIPDEDPDPELFGYSAVHFAVNFMRKKAVGGVAMDRDNGFDPVQWKFHRDPHEFLPVCTGDEMLSDTVLKNLLEKETEPEPAKAEPPKPEESPAPPEPEEKASEADESTGQAPEDVEGATETPPEETPPEEESEAEATAEGQESGDVKALEESAAPGEQETDSTEPEEAAGVTESEDEALETGIGVEASEETPPAEEELGVSNEDAQVVEIPPVAVAQEQIQTAPSLLLEEVSEQTAQVVEAPVDPVGDKIENLFSAAGQEELAFLAEMRGAVNKMEELSRAFKGQIDRFVQAATDLAGASETKELAEGELLKAKMALDLRRFSPAMRRRMLEELSHD